MTNKLLILVGLWFKIQTKVSFCVSLVDFISTCCIFCCTVSVQWSYHHSARAALCIQPLSNHCYPAATTASGHSMIEKKKHGTKTEDHGNLTLRTKTSRGENRVGCCRVLPTVQYKPWFFISLTELVVNVSQISFHPVSPFIIGC